MEEEEEEKEVFLPNPLNQRMEKKDGSGFSASDNMAGPCIRGFNLEDCKNLAAGAGNGKKAKMGLSREATSKGRREKKKLKEAQETLAAAAAAASASSRTSLRKDCINEASH